VAAYLASLELLAKVHRLYWGPAMRLGANKNDLSSKFTFVGGMSIAMSRDLAEWIAASARGAMKMGPFYDDRDRYKATNHADEDVMWACSTTPVCRTPLSKTAASTTSTRAQHPSAEDHEHWYPSREAGGVSPTLCRCSARVCGSGERTVAGSPCYRRNGVRTGVLIITVH
jgi:hypothetical protein